MLLSILIPTKDRYSTLIPVLDSIRSIKSKDYEVVIQDNSSDNFTILNYLQLISDERLKYYYSKSRLSQTENSDLAVKNSVGKFVCFIGDDDGILPQIIEVVKMMERRSIGIIKCNVPDYYWPKMRSNSTSQNVTGIISINTFNYSFIKVECRPELKKVLKKGGTKIGGLPCLYHGIVKRSVLDKIYQQCNSFFPGPSPDMANAVALSFFEEYYWYLDIPIVISGKSIDSIGGQGVLHNHVNRIENVNHLPNDILKTWSKEIPAYWTGQTIWAESLLKTSERCGHQEIKKQMNFSHLYAALIIFNWKYRNEIFKGFSGPIFSLKLMFSFFQILIERTKIFIKNRTINVACFRQNNVESIEKAIEIVGNMIDYNKLKKF